MSTKRYGLRDDQWERIKDLLPGRKGTEGRPAKDNRLFVEAVLYRYRAGIPWRDLPERFGDWKIVHQRFGRWAKSGIFARVFNMLASDHATEFIMIDAPIVRPHQHSAGARKKTEASDRTVPRRTDDQNPCDRRRAWQSRCDFAYAWPSLRPRSGRNAPRRGRPASLSRRQSL